MYRRTSDFSQVTYWAFVGTVGRQAQFHTGQSDAESPENMQDQILLQPKSTDFTNHTCTHYAHDDSSYGTINSVQYLSHQNCY